MVSLSLVGLPNDVTIGHTARVSAHAAERTSLRQALGLAEFRAVLFSSALSTLGDQVTRIAVAVLVYERTNSPFFATATLACSYLTWLLAGPFLSAIADRCRWRRLMVGCDLARAALITLLLIPDVPLWLVFAVLLLVGMLAPPFDAAKSALLPEILTGEQYLAGNAVVGAVNQGAMVGGFLLGGLLVATLSPQGALAVDAATFVVSALLLGFGLRPRPRPEPSGNSLARDARDGISVVAGSPRLRLMLGYGLLGSITMIAPEGLAVPVADQLGGGAATAGLLTAALPAGFLLGSFAVLRVAPDRREKLLPVLTGLACVPLLLSAFAPSTTVLAGLWALSGACSASQLVANAAYMLSAPEGVRARAFGVAVSLIMATQGVTLLAVGALAERFDPRLAVAIAGIVALLLLVPIASAGRSPAERARPDATPAAPSWSAAAPRPRTESQPEAALETPRAQAAPVNRRRSLG